MIICHSRRFVFFSNPKTGSESVRALLHQYQEEEVRPFWEHRDTLRFYPHMRPLEARRAFEARGWPFEDYFRLTYTRNPWARLVSLFEMIQANAGWAFGWKRHLRTGYERVLGREGDAYFRDWLLSTEPFGRGGGGSPEERWRRFGTWTLDAYVGDDEGNSLVDSVIRLESQRDELPAILDRIGLDAGLARQIPHVNRRSRRHYSNYYDEKTRGLVLQRYRVEIDQFGYGFDFELTRGDRRAVRA